MLIRLKGCTSRPSRLRASSNLGACLAQTTASRARAGTSIKSPKLPGKCRRSCRIVRLFTQEVYTYERNNKPS